MTTAYVGGIKMLLEVLQNYRSDTPNPIELLVGDTVQIGEESEPNGAYPNWVFCISNRNNQKGWVPMHILTMKNRIGVAKEDYTSKEMAVMSRDVVDTIYELNGWYWCKRQSDSEMGWVAKDNLKALL